MFTFQTVVSFTKKFFAIFFYLSSLLVAQWCTFQRGSRKCEYEWKRTPYNITVLDCNDFQGRAEFQVKFSLCLYYQITLSLRLS